ncbi:MAG: Flp family type IVb pilin [Phycisphaerae bacterium]|jgi:pilus assembly protein Flp/PilA|nr:Flp family type IVb pilin [Phycisphaerae bacterium]HOO15646.1 Flp family type IVb pilin [Phycisphaerae bacterium]HPC22807.1 Flp family type IVb pilin [Phycisphaerae bacterium]HRS28632.1 Flp family type IVb pilin [Phycisphaerae bacterium]HRT42411.1 Flp family type IVb pilin [Phycisphaerae bacterium]
MRMFTPRHIAALRRFGQEDDGPTATEYAVLLALIVLVILTAIVPIGTSVNDAFRFMVSQLGG